MWMERWRLVKEKREYIFGRDIFIVFLSVGWMYLVLLVICINNRDVSMGDFLIKDLLGVIKVFCM